jgi:hypothetical protein
MKEDHVKSMLCVVMVLAVAGCKDEPKPSASSPPATSPTASAPAPVLTPTPPHVPQVPVASTGPCKGFAHAAQKFCIDLPPGAKEVGGVEAVVWSLEGKLFSVAWLEAADLESYLSNSYGFAEAKWTKTALPDGRGTSVTWSEDGEQSLHVLVDAGKGTKFAARLLECKWRAKPDDPAWPAIKAACLSLRTT